MTGEPDSMTLASLLFWVCFIFSLALTAGGISLLFRYKALRSVPAFSYLQYSLILVYVFGFYVLWTGLFLNHLPFSSEISSFSKLVILLGTPFLLGASILQLLLVQHLLELRRKRLLVAVVLLADTVAVWAYLHYTGFGVVAHASSIYEIAGVIASVSSSMLMLIFGTSYFSVSSRQLLAGIFALLGALYGSASMDILPDVWGDLVFALLFFLLNTALCVVFVYSVQRKTEPGTDANNFDIFVKKHSITSRESEIILEICKGKSNQQVADTLFVTLQTVKDHTSRIYQKTGVKSRAQLVMLVRDFS